MKSFKKVLKEIESNYTVTVSAMEPSEDTKQAMGITRNGIPTVELASFDNKSDANKHKRFLMKKYKLTKHGSHVVNYDDFIELTTNY